MAGKLNLDSLKERFTDFEKSCEEIYDAWKQNKTIQELAEEYNLTVGDIDEILREVDPSYDEN